MKTPKISVVLPTYNHAAFVKEALESIVNQTYQNIEIIAIDDGSIDETPKILNRLFEKYSLFKRHKLIVKENEGAHNTINRGISESNSEWITILNSDDRYYPRRLEKLMKVAQSVSEREHYCLVYSLVNFINKLGDALDSKNPVRQWYLGEMKRKNLINSSFRFLYGNVAITTGNLLFNRRLFDRLGGFNPYVLNHDYDFILRSLFLTEPGLVEEVLLDYRIHETNTISTYQSLYEFECYEVASHFVREILVNSNPINKRTPCPSRIGTKFLDFWRKEEFCLKSWSGLAEIDSFFGSDENARGIDRQF